MNAVIQYDFFEPIPTELELVRIDMEASAQDLEKKFNLVKNSADKVRKCQFAEIGALKKEVKELRELVEILVKNICQK